MSRDGFEELYKQIPDEKSNFETIWKFHGGEEGSYKYSPNINEED